MCMFTAKLSFVAKVLVEILIVFDFLIFIMTPEIVIGSEQISTPLK